MPSSASDTLQSLTGPLEVKFKGGAFATWSDSFVRLEGRWLCAYKRERDAARQGAIELGPGVTVTDISNPETTAKFPRRFDVTCSGGLLPKTEVSFRTKSRKDRDQWVLAIAHNLQCLSTVRGQNPRFGVLDLAPLAAQLSRGVKLHPIRIRSDLTVRCATGESIVAFLVTNGFVQDRLTATTLCRQLVSMNLLHHVMWTQDFSDSPEPFVILSLDEDADSHVDTCSSTADDYQVAHFLKYMDSRRFWKYIASADFIDSSSVTAASNVSSGSRRGFSSSMLLDRSASSSDSSKISNASPMDDAEAARYSTLSSNNPALASSDPTEKKARKCAVCTKSFNPLRRRHHCRQCRAVICSNCSVIRRPTADAEAAALAPSRLCISCKLSSNASFMGEPDVGVESLQPPQAVGSSNDGVSSTPHDGMGNSVRQRSNGLITTPGPSDSCQQCANEVCAPLTEFAQISYAVDATSANSYVSAGPLDNETERLQSVNTLLVTLAATPSFSRVLLQFSNMAAIASQCPIAIVGLLDSKNYVLGAQHGVKLDLSVLRQQSLAAHTCRRGATLVCADLTRDIRFLDNPWRRETLENAAFYAGIPLTLSNGHTVGALEVFDAKPRYECEEVVAQLQAVVRGLLNLFEEIMTAAAQDKAEQEQETKAAQQAEEAVQETETKTEEPPANTMEAKLLQLLSQTTSTQEQLRTQQGQMVSAISSHSKQIDNLAKQLERIEATLAAKLDGATSAE